MKQFICGGTARRKDLLLYKYSTIKILINNLLQKGYFDTEWGREQVNNILSKAGIKEGDDDSVIAFAQSISHEYVGILIFEEGEDDYSFNIVSGTRQDINRMTRYMDVSS